MLHMDHLNSQTLYSKAVIDVTLCRRKSGKVVNKVVKKMRKHRGRISKRTTANCWHYKMLYADLANSSLCSKTLNFLNKRKENIHTKKKHLFTTITTTCMVLEKWVNYRGI